MAWDEEEVEREFLVTATITLRGVIAVVDAKSLSEAKAKANKEGADWQYQYGDVTDWEVTYVELNE